MLSILYLRCAQPRAVIHMMSSLLSILYLRCCQTVHQAQSQQQPTFNSLFEMHVSGRHGNKKRPSLSILYLRCGNEGAIAVATTYLELSILYLRCLCLLTGASPCRGRWLSILYLRCVSPSFGTVALPPIPAFNSLFEMQVPQPLRGAGGGVGFQFSI